MCTLQRTHLRRRPEALNPSKVSVPHVLTRLLWSRCPSGSWMVFPAGFPRGGRGTSDAVGRGTGDASAADENSQCFACCQQLPSPHPGVTVASIPAGMGCVVVTPKPPSSNPPCLTPQVFQRSSASPFLPKLRYDPLAAAVCPRHADMWPNGASVAAEGWKVTARSERRSLLLTTGCTLTTSSPASF